MDAFERRVEDGMSRLTIFLARFIGLFALLVSIAVLARGSAIVDTTLANDSVAFALALISLAGGLAIMLGHNVWTGGALPVVVTLVGWLMCAKGLMLLFVPGVRLMPLFERLQFGGHFSLSVLPALAIGLYLTWAGFTARLPRLP
jgi:hypothetical protein